MLVSDQEKEVKGGTEHCLTPLFTLKYSEPYTVCTQLWVSVYQALSSLQVLENLYWTFYYDWTWLNVCGLSVGSSSHANDIRMMNNSQQKLRDQIKVVSDFTRLNGCQLNFRNVRFL